jgi:hypothetical protein
MSSFGVLVGDDFASPSHVTACSLIADFAFSMRGSCEHATALLAGHYEFKFTKRAR